jgi:site-specific DNA-methyltransferase (adenine-specific)
MKASCFPIGKTQSFAKKFERRATHTVHTPMISPTLLLGDCPEALRAMPDASVDSVVTDPPYGLSFMGKKWDYDVPSSEIWRECLRVLKPGGHLLAFAGTRTQHRMAVNIEDAGFEIRDMIAWIYGSGFPKSHNLDGAWQGWGTALKPALEPITVARKPLVGTVAANVEAHGVGAMNIDGCRVAANPDVDDMLRAVSRKPRDAQTWETGSGFKNETNALTGVPLNGRWPANLIHDGSDEVVGLFPVTASGGGDKRQKKPSAFNACVKGRSIGLSNGIGGDTGSAARFFYCAKASKSDRDEGCESLMEKQVVRMATQNGASGVPSKAMERFAATSRNHHPTVKPTALMRYLCRLVTPAGGTVLDPFMGSGSTGKAAVLEGFDFIGIEREAEYMEIAKARIAAAETEAAQNLFTLPS